MRRHPQSRLLTNGPASAALTVVLVHGAGAAMDSPFMNTIATGLANRGYRVARFEFPYMAARREGRRTGAPDRESVLLQAWCDAIAELGGGAKLVIGGKSLGGRIASMVADEMNVRGLLCLGYPFHAPGRRADAHRLEHLRSMRTPALIVQGERDSFGNRDEVEGYSLAPPIRIAWMPDGDHSFKPRARSGHTEAGNLELAISETRAFLRKLAEQ